MREQNVDNNKETTVYSPASRFFALSPRPARPTAAQAVTSPAGDSALLALLPRPPSAVTSSFQASAIALHNSASPIWSATTSCQSPWTRWMWRRRVVTGREESERMRSCGVCWWADGEGVADVDGLRRCESEGGGAGLAGDAGG